jgi:heat shock protein HslJ
MNTPRPLLSLLVVIGLLIAACGGDGDGSDTTAAAPAGSLAATSWEGTRVMLGTTDLVIPPGAEISMTFDAAGREVTGRSACNSYFGSVQITGDTISFGDLGMTEMACADPQVMELESTFMTILGRVDRYSLSGGTLTLGADDGFGTVEFRAPAPIIDAALEGPLWSLDTIVIGAGASSVVAGTSPSIRLTANGISGDTGCNDFGGEYRTLGNEIEFTIGNQTERGCAADVMDQEATLLDILENAVSWEISGPALTIATADDRALVFRSG